MNSDLMRIIKRNIKKLFNRFGFDYRKFYSVEQKDSIERFPPGHYYSSIPSVPIDSRSESNMILSKYEHLKDININSKKQFMLLEKLVELSKSPPLFSDEKKRFDFENDYFSYDDAPILSLMMRHIQPKKIIEIGCGYSTACILDTSEIFLNSTVDLTCIDINFNRLKESLLKEDYNKIKLYEKPIQEVDAQLFTELEENDLLFIDSSHIFKYGSDLEKIFFDILPVLNKGVYIHFHDIRYPFAYSKIWFENKVFLNEAYFLRSFLMNNQDYEISFWLNYIINHKHPTINELLTLLPVNLKAWDNRFNNGSNNFAGAGGSIYLKKVN